MMDTASLSTVDTLRPDLSTVDTLRAGGLPLTHMDGDAAIAHIERLEQETGGRVRGGEGLMPVSAIATLDNLFQPRTLTNWHVADLVRAVKSKRIIAPLLVLRIGERGFLLDGHHRLRAYKEVDKAEHRVSRVPCEFFDGTVAQAVLEARRRNSETKLAMSTTQKLDDAWKLVKMVKAGAAKAGGKVEYHFSKAEIVAASDVAKGTVGNMRKALETIGREEARAISAWEKARKLAAGKTGTGTMTADEVEERKRQMVEDWVGRLRKSFGDRFGKDTELTADVLHRYLGPKTEPVSLDMLGAAGVNVEYAEFRDALEGARESDY
jgi:ParB-like chromosome segregation protein Spo0J